MAIDSKFVSVAPTAPQSDNSALWKRVREKVRPRSAAAPSSFAIDPSFESNVSILTALNEAPPRTLHSAALVRSSPLSSVVREMLERRQFGERFDAVDVDLSEFRDEFTTLACPKTNVQFLANDASFDDLNFSVSCLLQHRKKLIEPTVSREPRKSALILGGGPGGLMTAIQLALRNHRVVVCEQREVYARNRFIGVYKEVSHLMAALGMPERMTYDFTHYRGKRGIMLADIQTFLHGVALKLGVIIYTGAVARNLTSQAVSSGEIELHRAARSGGGKDSQSGIGMTRWQYDTIARVISGVVIRFDTIVEATGGRSGLREILVGKENVVSIRTLAREAFARDSSLKSFFDDPNDHCAQFVESNYGCPSGLLPVFAAALQSAGDDKIPDKLPCFVSNIDASIFNKPLRPAKTDDAPANDLNIPRDWVVVECRLVDQRLTRYQVEGPLPQSFEFGGSRISTCDALEKINPISLLIRILYAMGVPFDVVDRKRLVEFYSTENSQGDASDIVATWIGNFRTLRLGGEKPIWIGKVPGSSSIEYGILGEALQNAWYRFGVGVDDTFAGAVRFVEGIELPAAQRIEEALRFEKVMFSRSVQVLYHVYSVSGNSDQGVVGPVLTEYYIDEQHNADLTEARLRDLARNGAEIVAAKNDLCADDREPLLGAALDFELESCCRKVLKHLESFSYSPDIFIRPRELLRTGAANWRSIAFAAVEPSLVPAHRELLAPLFSADSASQDHSQSRPRQERLIDLALGRYSWVGAWLRACALRAIDPNLAGGTATLKRAAIDPDPLVSETAQSALQGSASVDRSISTIEKVMILREVSIFKGIPHQTLAGVASLLTERWVDAGERILNQGDFGDCLYVIASGRVRVHNGERTFNALTRNQCFGELSLLDAEPRSASVTAEERSHLLLLGQSSFYALLSEQPEISRAINRTLCGMVRRANASAARA